MFQAPATDTDPSAGGFRAPDHDEDAPSAMGMAGNALQEIKDAPGQLLDFGKAAVTDPIGTAKSVPGALWEEAKRIGVKDLVTDGPVAAGNTFRGALYDKPVSTVLDVIPAVGAAGKVLGVGKTAAETASLASKAATAAKVADVASDAEKVAGGAAKAEDLLHTPPVKGGGTPASRIPPPPEPPPVAGPKVAPETPPPAAGDPLKDVKDYIASKGAKVESKPGWQERAAKYVKNEVADLRAKDIGLRDPMIRSLDRKNPLKALDKAEALMEYAGKQGYFNPGLTNVARKELVQNRTEQFGKNIGGIRAVGGQRAQAPVAEVRDAIKQELSEEYGGKASKEIKTVLADYDRLVKKDPSFQGLADVATYLNKEKSTFNKLGQNDGPTTDAANIVSRINNDSLRKVLSPEEAEFYTKNLRDFGAHKKIEQMVASSARRGMTGRGAPGGMFSTLWQQLWDRGGYRMAGNVADRVSGSVLKNPEKFKTIPDFFEEFGHHADDVLDETIAGMSEGGVIPHDVRDYVSRGC